MTIHAPPPTRTELLTSVSDMIRTVDERAADVNRRYGFNRLPHLVPIDLMEKFRRQKRKWEEACFECTGSPLPEDRDRVRRQADAMLRGFDALEAAAHEAGHFPSPCDWWEFELRDGTPVMLVRTRAEMGQVDPKGRAAQIWSLEEISDIIEKFPMLIRAKDSFPGAEVIQCRTNPLVVDELNDSLSDLPF